MRRITLAAILLAVASPARADLTIEYSGTVSLLPMLEEGTAKMTTRVETRKDRTRVIRCGTDSRASEGTSADTSIEVIREDKHVRWEFDRKRKTYLEYPWPDTLDPETRASIEAETRSGMPDSVQHHMDEMGDLVTEIRPTGEHTTLRGYPVEHFIVESKMRKRPENFAPGMDFGGIHDIWVTKAVPDLGRIKEQLDAFNRLTSLSQPSYEEFHTKGQVGESALPGYSDKIEGLPVRYIVRMKMMDSTGIAEYAKARAAAAADSTRPKDPLEESIDPKTGSMVLMDMELTLLSEEPIDDSHFEIPAGYKKDDLQPKLTPRVKAKHSSGHSPR